MDNKSITLICLHTSEMYFNESDDLKHFDQTIKLNIDQITNIHKTGEIAVSFFVGKQPKWANPIINNEYSIPELDELKK